MESPCGRLLFFITLSTVSTTHRLNICRLSSSCYNNYQWLKQPTFISHTSGRLRSGCLHGQAGKALFLLCGGQLPILSSCGRESWALVSSPLTRAQIPSQVLHAHYLSQSDYFPKALPSAAITLGIRDSIDGFFFGGRTQPFNLQHSSFL